MFVPTQMCLNVTYTITYITYYITDDSLILKNTVADFSIAILLWLR